MVRERERGRKKKRRLKEKKWENCYFIIVSELYLDLVLFGHHSKQKVREGNQWNNVRKKQEKKIRMNLSEGAPVPTHGHAHAQPSLYCFADAENFVRNFYRIEL